MEKINILTVDDQPQNLLVARKIDNVWTTHGIDLAVNKIGIFGKLTQLDRELATGDRVEIYRPLIADPKEARRRRAKAAAKKR